MMSQNIYSLIHQVFIFEYMPGPAELWELKG